MKRFSVFLGLFLLFSGFAYQASAALNLYDEPRKLPTRQIYSSTNKKVKLSDFKGQFVLAVFWSRYCYPCLKEMNALNAFSNNNKDNGLKVIIISHMGEWNTVDEQTNMIKKFDGQDLDSYVDEKGFLASDLGIFTTPNTVLINKDGKEIGRISGSVEWDNQDVVEYIYKIKAQN